METAFKEKQKYYIDKYGDKATHDGDINETPYLKQCKEISLF